MGLCLYGYNDSVQSIITDMPAHFGNTTKFDFRTRAACLMSLCIAYNASLVCCALKKDTFFKN